MSFMLKQFIICISPRHAFINIYIHTIYVYTYYNSISSYLDTIE